MRYAAHALLVLLAVALACTPRKLTSVPAAQQVCDRLFALAVSGRCGGPPPPEDAVEPMRSRYRVSCLARLGQTGSSWTAASLDACAAAAEVQPCDATERPPACIVIPGALSDGSPCADDAQCASTRCARAFGTPPDGGAATVPSCGTCAPAGRAGEPCRGGPGGGCVDGTECVGSGTARRCVPMPAQVSPEDGGAAGSDPGAAQQARVLAWAVPGESCDSWSLCIHGACPGGGGKCPTVIADGTSCVAFDQGSTCDFFSACTDGVCGLEYSVACP
jgi:hypothetical protein